MKYFTIVSMALLMMTGCKQKNNADRWNDTTETDIMVEDTYQEKPGSLGAEIDSLGYYGVWEGSQPGPGSRTVKAKLTLYDNNRYEIHSVDIDDNTQTEHEEGTYLIFGDLLTLTPDNDSDKKYYRTDDDGHVTVVDENKKEIPALHSQNFRLIKK